jgi:hypothetical protein
MAYETTHPTTATELPHRILGIFGRVFSALGLALVAIPETNRRIAAMQRLQEKSDAELAARGLRREDIARHVFIDMQDL